MKKDTFEYLEREVLGPALYGSEASRLLMASRLRETAFTTPMRRAMFQLLSQMESVPSEARQSRLTVELSEQWSMRAVADELMSIAEGYATDANHSHFVDRLAEQDALRRFADIGRRAFSGKLRTTEEVVAEFNEVSSDILGRKNSDGHQAAEVARQLFDDMESIAMGQKVSEGLRTGLRPLDVNGGLFPGELWTLCATPGFGKTALALQVAKACGSSDGEVVYISLEMPKEELVRRMISQGEGDIGTVELREAKLNEAKWGIVAAKCSTISGTNITIYDARATVDEIAASCKFRALSGNVRLVVIDYLQIISLRPGLTWSESVRYSTGTLKSLSKDIGAPILLLSQLNREGQGKRGGELELRDAAGSLSVSEDSDALLFFSREKGGTEVECTVLKNRHGPPGMCHMTMNPRTYEFKNAGGYRAFVSGR